MLRLIVITAFLAAACSAASIPNCTLCGEIFSDMANTMQSSNFTKLVDDGGNITLDCSANTTESRDQCLALDVKLCYTFFDFNFLDVAWTFFCNNQDQTLLMHNCFKSGKMGAAIEKHCRTANFTIFNECSGDLLELDPSCDVAGSNAFSTLLFLLKSYLFQPS